MCDNCECDYIDNPCECKQEVCHHEHNCDVCKYNDPCECECHIDWEADHYEHKSDTERGV